MSKERANNRAAREREAAIRQAARGHEQDRQDRIVSMKDTGEVFGKHGGPAITQPTHHKTPKNGPGTSGAGTSGAGKSGAGKSGAVTSGAGAGPAAKGAGAKGRPTPKQSAAQAPKKRATAPVGRPDGPLARRRRFRTRLLVALFLLVNVAAALIWRDWAVSVAVFIVSAILAPLLAAALLRRK